MWVFFIDIFYFLCYYYLKEMIKIGKNNRIHPYDDLTDRDFGEYHVIRRLDIKDRHKGSTFWLCLYRGEQVEKSRKFLIRQSRLYEDNKKACTKLIGKRFGMLTVISYEFKDKRSHKHWKCKCDCGNVKTFEEYVITSGKVTSCGCVGKASRISANIKDDLKGKRFGRLTALYYAGDDKWHCKCDCGNEKDIVRGSLIRGLTKSCGCLHTEVMKDRVINMVGEKHNKLTALYYFIS